MSLTRCRLIEGHQCLEGTYCVLLQIHHTETLMSFNTLCFIFTLNPIKNTELVFSFLNNECTFLFSYFCSIYPTYVSAVTRPSSRYIDKFTSLFTGPFDIITEPLHCLRLLFTLAITSIQNFSSSCFLKCFGVYSIYLAFEV
jgi:hypothetical protein